MSSSKLSPALKCFVYYIQGLSRNKTLKHLSFENCQIGDNGFEGKLNTQVQMYNIQ